MVGAQEAVDALLLCYKPDLFLVDARGNTAAHAAAKECNTDVRDQQPSLALALLFTVCFKVLLQLLDDTVTAPATAIALLHLPNDLGQSPLELTQDDEQVWQAVGVPGQSAFDSLPCSFKLCSASSGMRCATQVARMILEQS